MPATITLHDLGWSTPDGHDLFQHLDLSFGAERTGLVGRNGIGKTRLLRLVDGDLTPQSGTVTTSGRIAVLRQSVRPEPDETVASLFGVTAGYYCRYGVCACGRFRPGSSWVAESGNIWNCHEHFARKRHSSGVLSPNGASWVRDQMKRLLGSAGWLFAMLVLAFNIGGAIAQDRAISLMPGTDLPGFDYSVVKNTTLDACSAACADDRICRAFTFNEKAKWCFLKGAAGPETAFTGATSGKVDPAAEQALVAERQAELPFPASDLVYYAQYFAQQLPSTDVPPQNLSYDDLVSAGDDAAATGNSAAANVSYRQALALNRNDPALWLKLVDVQIDRADADLRNNNSSSAYDFAQTATWSATNAFLLSESVAERAKALARLAAGFERRTMWRESIATYRASIALVDDAGLQGRLDQVVAEHGFRIASNEVDSEAADPRICVVFSDPLPAGDTDLSSYIVVDGAPQVAVETEQSQLCITGVRHGQRYSIRVRSGLPSANGEQLRADAELNVYVPDRSPFVGFANNAYVMPAGLGGGLPITSVNAETAEVVIYRIGDRSIATAVRNGIFQRTLDGYSAEDVASQHGEKLWEGEVDLARAEPNQMTTTAIPVSDALKDKLPGAYVITAKVKGVNQDYWREMATQWFIVTDLGLTTVEGEDGVHAFVRSLNDASPVAGAKVTNVEAMVIESGLDTSLLGMSYLGRLSKFEATRTSMILRP